MKDLIAKLEVATDGSRELDAEVACALDPKRHSPNKIEPGCYSDGKGEIRGAVAPDFFYSKAPLYTTSLDAALTLVPEGCGWIVESDGGASVHRLEKAAGGGFPIIGEFGIYGEPASTPALALSIAALKARAA